MNDQHRENALPVVNERRRAFLEGLAATGVVLAGGHLLSGCSRPEGATDLGVAPESSDTPEPEGRRLPGSVDGRVLVVVNLEGGNDGLSTLIPANDPLYYDLRPSLAVPQDEVLELDDEVALHPSLERLHRRGITTIEGVGPVSGDLSHFAMTERWERGDATGEHALRTGFLGRLTDALDDGSPLVGASLSGPTPFLVNQKAATMSLSRPDELWYLEPTDWGEARALQNGWEMFDGGPNDLGQLVRRSYDQLGDLASKLLGGRGGEMDWEDPMIRDGGELGQGLYTAADLINADVGVRVIYAQTGSYDTHSGHGWQQASNLTRVDAAIDGFLKRADDMGFGDKVLVATVSEFGRRVAENDGGLDHGAGSTMLLAGPVGNERLGERPPLDELDDDGNLQVGIGFDRYLATLAEEWLGVEASSVLPGEPAPLEIF